MRCVDRTNRRIEKVVADKALATISKNVMRANELVDKFGQKNLEYDRCAGEGIHESHTIKQVHDHPHAFFCDKCGAWSIGKSLRGLSAVCSGSIAKCRVFQHRLLQCGVIPTPGARIPQHARKRARQRSSVNAHLGGFVPTSGK